MKRVLKNWAIEIAWAAGSTCLSLIYILEKISIRCEPCIDLSCCPPCQTRFMADFWLHMAIFNAIIVGSMIVRRSIPRPS